MLNRKPRFEMPHLDKYNKLFDAIWDYYKLCLPQYSADDRYDLVRDVTITLEDTMRRLYGTEGNTDDD